jgi:hypothetical protein
MSPKDLTGMRYRGEESLPEHSRCNATSSEALEAPDTQRVIEAFKDMPGRELVEMIGHARRLEKRLRRVAHNIVGPYVGIEEHSERVANALTELDRLQQSAQSENAANIVQVLPLEPQPDAVTTFATAWGPEKQDYPGGPVYRVGTSTGATLPEQPPATQSSTAMSREMARDAYAKLLRAWEKSNEGALGPLAKIITDLDHWLQGMSLPSATVEIDPRMLMLIRVLDDLEESGNGWNPATMPRSANEAERKFRDMLATNWKDIRRLIPIRASDGGSHNK